MRRTRAARYGRPPSPGSEPDARGLARWKTPLALAATILLAIGAATWLVVTERMSRDLERDPQTLCLVRHQSPRAVLVLLDTTDQLARDSGERFKQLIGRIRDDLPRNGRLIIVPFGGDLGVALTPGFDVCSPGRGSEANEFAEGPASVERAYAAQFRVPLERIAQRLTEAGTSDSSPIAQQIERAVNDPAIRWAGAAREVVLISDGLQHDAASRVYVGQPVRLPDPPPALLAGVTVSYVELANPRHSALQTAQMREAWRTWFEQAGAARINMYAPGYPPAGRADSAGP